MLYASNSQVNLEDPPRARQLRAHLVEHLVRMGDVRSPRVRDALLRVPRHLFVPPPFSLEQAYANHPAPIGLGQTISQPTIVATMTEALELRGSERVLEVGTGSGYQAAVLSLLASEVFSIEFFPELAKRAAHVLMALGCSNVRVRAGDGTGGWPEHAPFDRIIATAAAARVPSAWLAQLGDPGMLVTPVETALGQELVRFRKHNGLIQRDHLGPVSFVPLLSRTEASIANLR
jgi:protein-L-isoaspartate(D-aspartate) O-methyltransferase